MPPFSHDLALGFFRKVASSVAAGDTICWRQGSTATSSARCSSGLNTPPNQPHRATSRKCWCIARRAARHRRRLDRGGGRRSPAAWPLASCVGYGARRKRPPALHPCRLEPNRDRSGLCAVSGWPSLRHGHPCGSGWIGDRGPSFRAMWTSSVRHLEIPGLVLAHHPGMTERTFNASPPDRLPADHRLLAGDAPVVAGQRAALAECAMAGHHERDRFFRPPHPPHVTPWGS